MVNPQVVDDQNDFFARAFDQGFEEFNRFAGIEGFINGHPTGFALYALWVWLVTVAIMEMFARRFAAYGFE